MTATPDPATRLTPGLRNPDKRDLWLVPPWPRNASYCTVVRHFLRWQPWNTRSARIMLVYFRAYQAALELAPAHALSDPAGLAWRAEMRSCIGWCISVYEAPRQLREAS